VSKLVDVLAETMGDVFPEIRAKRNHVKQVIQVEEEGFNRTLDEGIHIFQSLIRLRGDLDELVRRFTPRLKTIRESLATTTVKTPAEILEAIAMPLKENWCDLDESFRPWKRVATQ